MKLGVMIVVSVGAHLVAGWAMARMPRRPSLPPASVVEMTVVDRPPPPPPPPEEPQPVEPLRQQPVRPRPATAPRHRPAARPAPAAQDIPSDAPAIAAEPLDFTDGPALPVGGGPDTGPATPAPRGPGPRSTGTGTGTVPLADLSRPPEPPSLDDALARRYPVEARAAGRTGRAVVRVRIEADGRAAVLRMVTASEPAFGAACRATVDGSRWRAPLDAGGKAVPTEITYTCNFEVQP